MGISSGNAAVNTREVAVMVAQNVGIRWKWVSQWMRKRVSASALARHSDRINDYYVNSNRKYKTIDRIEHKTFYTLQWAEMYHRLLATTPKSTPHCAPAAEIVSTFFCLLFVFSVLFLLLLLFLYDFQCSLCICVYTPSRSKLLQCFEQSDWKIDHSQIEIVCLQIPSIMDNEDR